MKVHLDGKNIEVTVFEHRKGNFEYFIGDVQIGEIDTNIAKYDNIIMRQNSIVKALEKLGVLVKSENIKQNTLENELSAKIKDQIDNLSREDIEQSAKETDEIDKYIEENGIERKQIKDVRILKLDTREKSNETRNDQIAQKNYQSQKIKKATSRDVNIKQELKLDERANDMHSIRKWLGGQVPHSIEKIGVIESYEMNKMKNEKGQKYSNGTTRYSLVAISKDGKIEPLQKYIPELQQRSASGNDPISKKYQVRDDGSVEKDSVLSEYEIGDKVIQLDNKEMGRVEMNIGEEARNSTETMGIQLRDSNTIFATDTSQRSVIGEYEKEGEDTVEQNLKEVRQHPNCQKLDERDIDGDPNTQSPHEHIISIDNDEYIKICARKILDNNPEIKEVYNQSDIEKKLVEKIAHESLNSEELENNLDKISEEIKEESEREHDLPGTDRRNI